MGVGLQGQYVRVGLQGQGVYMWEWVSRASKFICGSGFTGPGGLYVGVGFHPSPPRKDVQHLRPTVSSIISSLKCFKKLVQAHVYKREGMGCGLNSLLLNHLARIVGN